MAARPGQPPRSPPPAGAASPRWHCEAKGEGLQRARITGALKDLLGILLDFDPFPGSVGVRRFGSFGLSRALCRLLFLLGLGWRALDLFLLLHLILRSLFADLSISLLSRGLRLSLPFLKARETTRSRAEAELCRLAVAASLTRKVPPGDCCWASSGTRASTPEGPPGADGASVSGAGDSSSSSSTSFLDSGCSAEGNPAGFSQLDSDVRGNVSGVFGP